MMQKMIAKFARFDNEEGATMIEYGLIVGLVSVVTITILTAVGGSLNALYGAVNTALQSAL
jgi:pilus assembly protein Flp/PilA